MFFKKHILLGMVNYGKIEPRVKQKRISSYSNS